MRRGFVLSVAGIAIGLAGACELTGVLQTLLFHVSATDRVTFAAIAALFLVVALAASYIPARRAARIDPMADSLYAIGLIRKDSKRRRPPVRHSSASRASTCWP